MSSAHRLLLLIAFAASGFAGLVYETIWSQYLRLVLGHSAYAQTAVLALFMGGMAIGAAACSRRSAGLRRPLRLYAVVEGGAGTMALAFHPAFVGLQALSTRLAASWAHPLLGWALASLLVLAPSILLGATFPSMAAGLARLDPARSGRIVSALYAANCFGGALGCLVGGFVLVGWLGLPASLAVAGALSLASASAAWRVDLAIPPAEAIAPLRPGAGPASGAWLFLGVSFATGAASFAYEVGWIRMLSLVLGSSVHSFELMLAAFILGLALGGLWIRGRMDRIARTAAALAVIQVAMGCLAVATLPLYAASFDLMARLRDALPHTERGYLLFNLASQGIALGVMLPATFCAGTTLPLLTRALLDARHGERSIGAVYAANTVGGIAGAFLAIHVGFEQVGVKGVVLWGAALDVLAGLVLAWRLAPLAGRVERRLALAGVPIAVLAAGALLVRIDPLKAASGVYRVGELLDPSAVRILFSRDGRTASIAVAELSDGERSFRTNGKADAGLMPEERPPSEDEPTMVLLGALPAAVHPGARVVANIGLGSGLTTHTLLADPDLQRVDTVEIERAMIEAARRFGWPSSRAFRDPRSVIHVADARTFFAARPGAYDVVVSEPSNPWISGVAGLFSREFYRSVRGGLARGGILVQWLQLYEIDLPLVLSILKTIAAEFDDFHAYAANEGDLLLVARNGPLPDALDAGVFARPELARLLARVDVRNTKDLEIRRVATRRSMAGLLADERVPVNSDYLPVVEQRAPKQLFLSTNVTEIIGASLLPVPATEMLTWDRPTGSGLPVTPARFFPASRAFAAARALRDALVSGGDPPGDLVEAELQEQARRVRQIFACRSSLPEPERLDALHATFTRMVTYLTRTELEPVWTGLGALGCAGKLSPQERSWYALFQAVGSRDAAAMARHAPALLEEDPSRYSAEGLKFLVANGMLGRIVIGDRSGATALWTRYSPLVARGKPPGYLFRLLLAAAEQPPARPR